jgi:hypothetical protein
MLIFCVLADGRRNYLCRVPKDFDVQKWANEPSRRKAFALFNIVEIMYEEI